MMGKWKKAGGMLALALALSTSCISTQAFAEGDLEQVKSLESSQQAAGKIGYGSTGNIDIQALKYLMSGSSTIQVAGSTKLHITANTRAYQPVDSISVTPYLEKWDSPKGQWVTVLNTGTTTQYLSSYVSTSKDLSVVKGEIYRLRVVHRVLNAGVVEEKTSISSYVETK